MRNKLMVVGLIVASLTIGLSLSYGETEAASNPAGIQTFSPDQLTWNPAPAPLPPGAFGAVMEGDPGKPGPFTLRFRLPAHYKVPPHWHTGTEHATVIEGDFLLGIGSSGAEENMECFGPGSFVIMQPRNAHYAMAGDEGCIIQLHGIGPWDIHFVNPDGSEITQ
ncbi:MAG: cupin domain-containing protein [bacterium]|nr:cupin domain-containing protein [bacterium]